MTRLSRLYRSTI